MTRRTSTLRFGSRSLGRHLQTGLTLATCCLLFCSCQAIPTRDSSTSPPTAATEASAPSPTASQSAARAAQQSLTDNNSVALTAANAAADFAHALPRTDVVVGPRVGPAGPYPAPLGTACPSCEAGSQPPHQWIPPGLAPPWPQDEYLCDGGDAIPSARVRTDWSVDGMGLEDTIAHYDTRDGQTRVVPFNRVCVYAPRFAAVRKVYGLMAHESNQLAAGVDTPTSIRGMGDAQLATTAIQPVAPESDRSTLTASAFRERDLAPMLENRARVIGIQGALLPYEDFTLIREGRMDNGEKARLAERTAAAATWSRNQAVQIIIDNIAAHVDVGSNAVDSVHVYKMHGKSRLRVCKVASRRDAQPGEIVEFTLRFDNIGDQLIGNVTVIDNLTTRLQYVDGSQSCSRTTDFATRENQGNSLMLRWEITDPIKVGEGGVIRFKCRVR